MKAVVAAFNQENALVGAFSVITNPRVDLRLKLYYLVSAVQSAGVLTGRGPGSHSHWSRPVGGGQPRCNSVHTMWIVTLLPVTRALVKLLIIFLAPKLWRHNSRFCQPEEQD